jgi:ribonuclease HI
MKKKYYVVWKGKKQGIYDSWAACQEQVSGVADAKFKSFESLQEAQSAYKGVYQDFIGKEKKEVSKKINIPYAECICVDAACNMQTGDMEYRGVHYPSGKLLFHKKGFQDATNNIGEFLAVVHALAFQKQHQTHLPIYSDSKTALSWLKYKKCKTEQAKTPRNQDVFDLIARAEKWLQENEYSSIPVLKWDTENWGEIPADFGRK